MLKAILWKYRREVIILGLALSLMGGAFAYGYHRGTVNQVERYAEERIQMQEQLLDLGEDLSLRNAELIRLQEVRQGLIDDLEQQAMEADGSNLPGVSATGGLQRLSDRWGPSIGTTR